MAMGMAANRVSARLLLAGALLIVPAALSATAMPARAASEVSVIVNHQPITTYQIRQREAFLKLRRTPGNLAAKAKDELIDEALKKQEIARLGIDIPQSAVDQAYDKFASQNKLTTAQLGQVLSHAGFSEAGFKDYIRTQMGWGQAVQAHVRSKEKLSEQDVVQRMLAQGGQKPKTTEYTLQQIIFVIPNGKQSSMQASRMREANGLRNRFTSCSSTYDLAKSLRDVTVRDLGRVAQPELPPRWKDDIMQTSTGKLTRPQATEHGVEMIAVCDQHQISDDRAAQMIFQSRDLKKIGEQKEPDAEYLKDLRKDAQIQQR